MNTGSKKILITELSTLEVPEALNLAWKVFQEYESPDYSKEGTEEFRKCLHDNAYLDGITYFGAYDEEKLVGLVGIRLKEGHICFFFVDGAYHRRGIGRSLFEFVKSRVYVRPITLNSSPYGLPFYNALGFKAVSAEQTVNGIGFTPMVFDEKTKMNDNLEGKL